MDFYLTSPGRLRRKENTLRFELLEDKDAANEKPPPALDEDESLWGDEELEATASKKKPSLPVETIDALYVFREVSFNSKVLNFLSQKKIPLHIFNYYGSHAGTYLPHAEQISGELVIRQATAAQDEVKRLGIARALLDSTLHNLGMNLRYYQTHREAGVEKEISQIASLRQKLPEATCTEALMGLEGAARRVYYSCWQKWLPEAGSKFTRQYRPPDNPVNALLSFLNSLLYTTMVSEMSDLLT